jgi:mono/diheme cytochrome c family protein
MDTGQVLLIAVVVLGPAAILWAIFWSRQNKARKPAALLGIPANMRPGAPDETLEGPRLTRVITGGVVFTVVLVFFIVVYWLPERERQAAFVERFEHGSVERGELVYQAPPELDEDADAAQFKEEEKALALGQNCANCHGGEGQGGLANPAHKDPYTGYAVAYSAPPLNNVFSRWDEEVVRFTIERGRPGTPMPTWGVDFGGSMTSMMVDDVIAYLKSIQVEPEQISDDCKKPSEEDRLTCGEEIFEVRCAVCHGPEGSGKEGPGTTNEPWYQGMALWEGDVGHLSDAQHYFTIVNGRRFAFMPSFGEAPAQGIPVSPNPLTDEQIEAVMEYERSL